MALTDTLVKQIKHTGAPAGDKHSDEYLIDRIKHGKGGAMPAFGRVFSDGQIIAILAYIRSLDDSGG